MSNRPDNTPTGSANLRSDGIRLQKGLASTSAPGSKKFWASNPRHMVNPYREILVISLGSKRTINHVSFKLSRFPLVCRLEYLDANGFWQGLTYAQDYGKGRNAKKRRRPVLVTIADSVPRKVNSSASTRRHPQHWTPSHWVTESVRVVPTETTKVRLVIFRNDRGTPPVNPLGKRVPYSVAVKDFSLGYRVNSIKDVPKVSPEVPWWASSQDILGSRTVYSTYRQPAPAVIDGDSSTFWRSEPQPFPFAVVNMFLDLRDAAGGPPVVDRWWVDPVTVGPVCNVYYSNDEPETEHVGQTSPIPQQWIVESGNPTVPTFGPDQTPASINFGPNTPCAVEVKNAHLRMRYDRPWWVGIDAQTLVDSTDPDDRPIAMIGDVEILQVPGFLMVRHHGATASVPLDPALYRVNSNYRLVVAYFPYNPASNLQPRLKIALSMSGYETIEEWIAVPAIQSSEMPVKIGLDRDEITIPAVAIKGLVLKAETLTDEAEDWFVEEGEKFVCEPLYEADDEGASQNARLRLHPQFRSLSTNVFGVVGGPGERYGDMEWTPVSRDYTLRRGYLHVPPTKAKYWKFEMTRLLPQIYENFVTINRDVLVFPPDVVEEHSSVTQGPGSNRPPSGVATLEGNVDNVAYRDVLEGARRQQVAADSTSVLVIKDIRLAEKAAESGWIWTYQPWHIGSTAPQFMGKQAHRYESINVNHKAKVAYFVGVKDLMPMRVDYSFDDDTPEYVEHLLDTTFIDLSQSQGVRHEEGAVVSLTTSSAQVVSEPFRSYRNVRGVQFAAQETDSFQVLPDPDFRQANLRDWRKYGDASLTLIEAGDAQISRGWFPLTYGDLETKYEDYGSMDGVLYGALEGNSVTTGYAEGGIMSSEFAPAGVGKVKALAKISAPEGMALPVRLEIVASATDRVVASAQAYPQQGESNTIEVGYVPGQLMNYHTYQYLEETYPTYGDMDGVSYRSLESNSARTNLYARLRQLGPSGDTFHVHRLAIYESPVAWYFSNDDGATWWQAVDVKNDPHSMLLFPEDPSPTPGSGRTLRWKARLFRAGATVNALHIRPIYGTRSRSSEGAHTMESLGPNRSIYDNLPTLKDHPMWGVRPPPDDGSIGVGSPVPPRLNSPVYGDGSYGGGPYGS